MPKNLKIPEKKRHRFSQPLGELIVGTRSQTIPRVVQRIKQYLNSNFKVRVYLVGDIVTNDFLENNFLKKFIKLCVIDEKTQRNKIKIKFEDFFEEIIEFENPESTIQTDSFELFREIMSTDRTTLLKITKGEEDLLVLPLVTSLPLVQEIKNLVFYGQPPVTDSKSPIPEGIVMVDVNKRIQKTVKKFISLMQEK